MNIEINKFTGLFLKKPYATVNETFSFLAKNKTASLMLQFWMWSKKADRMNSFELNCILQKQEIILEKRIILRLKDYIVQKCSFFQFHQCNLELYKIILSHGSFLERWSKRSNAKLPWRFSSKFFRPIYIFFRQEKCAPLMLQP